jgi:Tfp pilus assembly protein PilF
MATIYMNLGTVQTQMGEWRQAVNSLSKSLQIREQLGDSHGMAQTRTNLGVLYAKHGETAKARALWGQALEVFYFLGSQNEVDIVRKWLKNLPQAD